jgi:hypothetical protein
LLVTAMVGDGWMRLMAADRKVMAEAPVMRVAF